VSLTERDRKMIKVLAPLVLVLAYWFLVMSPKRSEVSQAKQERTEAQGKRDTAVARVGQLNAAKANFATDYAEVVRLGKAIPTSVDMPSLLIQLERAARGTDIEFKEINVGDRSAAGGAPGAAPAAASPPAQGAPGSADGSPAASAPGRAANASAGAVNQANANSAQAAQANPEGGAAPAPGGTAPATTQAAAPLDSVTLDITFEGKFFDLADLFHRLKRFVRVANDNIVVSGRLMTVDTFSFDEDRGTLVAKVKATVYLSPKAEGTTAGATPQGPAGADTATPAQPASEPAPSTPSTPPAATAIR
jgi:hypothetical protein